MTLKKLLAVEPYRYPARPQFKAMAYDAWVSQGGLTAKSYYPPRIFHKFAYRWEFPKLNFIYNRNGIGIFSPHTYSAHLRFVEPISIHFDSFPDNVIREIVPMVWDCWPKYFDLTAQWIESHHVYTAIFTSRDTAERMQKRLPKLNVLWCPEAVDVTLYAEGKLLCERKIDVFEFGRGTGGILSLTFPKGITYISSRENGHSVYYSTKELHEAMENSKVTIILPHSITNPEFSGGLETLTQRYWECMLARIVMVGHAPRELVDFIGYNPVIEVPVDENAGEAYTARILDIVRHPSTYQPLVDRNRETALRLGDWQVRMRHVMDWLEERGYRVK